MWEGPLGAQGPSPNERPPPSPSSPSPPSCVPLFRSLPLADSGISCYSNRAASPASEPHWRHVHCRIHLSPLLGTPDRPPPQLPDALGPHPVGISSGYSENAAVADIHNSSAQPRHLVQASRGFSSSSGLLQNAFLPVPGPPGSSRARFGGWMKEGEGREVGKEGRNRMNSRFSERLTPGTPQSLAQGRGSERWGEEHGGRPEPREGWGRRPGRQTADQGAQDRLRGCSPNPVSRCLV